MSAGLQRRLNAVFEFYARHPWRSVAVLSMVFCVVGTVFMDRSSVLREDDLGYMLKAREVARGDFRPMLSHSIGLSVLSAPVFALLSPESGPQSFRTARFVSILLAASVLLSAAWLVRLLLPTDIQLFVLLVLMLSPPLVLAGRGFSSEPPFSALVVLTTAASVRGMESPRFLILASALAGLGYWVRPNGFLLLGCVVVAGIAALRRLPGRLLVVGSLCLACFALVVLPMFAARLEEFGLGAFYGGNSKYFNRDYSEVGSWSDPVVSVGEYLQTATLREAFVKFFINGFVRVLFVFVHDFALGQYSQVVPPILLPFFALGLGIVFRKRPWAPCLAMIGTFVAGMSVVFSIFGQARLLVPLLPLNIVVAGGGLEWLRGRMSAPAVRPLLAGLAATVAAFGLVLPAQSALLHPTTAGGWAAWASANIRGCIAIMEGGDLIMMNLPDTSVAGVDLQELYAPRSGLRVTRPGRFASLEDALPIFAARGVTHIAVDAEGLKRRPYLAEILAGPLSGCFEQVYSERSRGGCSGMKIFRVRWDRAKEALRARHAPRQ